MSLGILRVLGIVLFLYLTWRSLKDDYIPEKVISYSWLALLGFLVLGRIGFGVLHLGVWKNWSDWVSVWNKPGMNYVAGILGMMMVTLWEVKINDWKFFRFVESNISSVMVLLWFLMADEFLRARMDLRPLIYLFILIMVFLINRFLSKRYRSFVWYGSGKKGFIFWSTLFLTFLFLTIVSVITKGTWLSIVFSLAVSLISLVGLFILGGVKKKI